MASEDFYQEYGPIERRRRDGDLTAQATVREVAEQPQPATRPARPTRKRRSRWRSFLWGVGLTLLLLLLAAGGGLWYLNRTFAGRIYPNVAIQGVDVSRMTPADATQTVQNHIAEFLQHPLVLTFNGRTWEPSLADLGVTVDVAGGVDTAYGLGRGVNLVSSVRAVATIWRDGYDLPIHITVDEAKLKTYLGTIGQDLSVEPINATLVIGQSSAAITPSRDGMLMLVDETALDIASRLHTLQSQTVPIRTTVLQPVVHDAGVAEAKRTVDAILQSPLTLTAGEDHQWELSQDDLRALIRLDRVANGDGTFMLQANLNEVLIRQRVATYADEIGRGTVNPRVAFNDGNLSIMREGQTGLRLDEQASAARITEQATIGTTRTIELVVNIVQPEVTAENLNTLGIVEPVGVGKSSFIGSAAYRIQNIKAGSRLLDGILIKPGDEFSFNDNIGSIDEANGFTQGYAIIGNRTQLEWGGGICQDSTTLFRAAFYAGLPITERHEHSFRITWYEVYETFGMDAAIYTGVNDFRFVNDTGNWLLLNTYVNVDTATVTYVLYGTKPNRDVIFDGPYVTANYPKPEDPVYIADTKTAPGAFEQTDTARAGMDITVYRIIKENGVVTEREPFYTHFKPWPDIFTHNPATAPPPKGCYPNKPCAALEPTPAPTVVAPEQPTAAPPAPAPEPTAVPPAPEPTPVPEPAPTPAPPAEHNLEPIPPPGSP